MVVGLVAVVSGPPDPMTVFREAAVQTHELFVTYTEAGFSESQALYLIGQMLRGTMAQQQRPDG